ncbi:MAG: hypothetical protein IPP76_10375 [Moraxellaceae bacterium]|nr:hypothetical protein [Moraxellaceae bacterium]
MSFNNHKCRGTNTTSSPCICYKTARHSYSKKIEVKKTETTPVTTTAPVIVAAPVAEFSHEQKLLIENAEKLDALNRELLVRNQQLQLTNEKLSLQAEMFKHDRYSEGTRDTLVTILLGILVGWFLSKTKKRARYRDF